MSYGLWGRTKPKPGEFYEKAYRRQTLADWDAKWPGLSALARKFFIHEVKGPAKSQAAHSTPPSVAAEKFPPEILNELTAAGFVTVRVGKSNGLTDRVIACEGLYDFISRVRLLHRLHLLAEDQPSELLKYVELAYYSGEFSEVLFNILDTAAIEDYGPISEILSRYVTSHRWPEWVARAIREPLAERILKVVQEADGPMLMATLIGRIQGKDPSKVRSVVDMLIAHLALFEDLHPETWELMVGFLPTVREKMIGASQPRECPPLLVCERIKEFGSSGSLFVNDLRAVLLEVASEPPRLRQDRVLFHKEMDRFLAPLEPVAPWLLEVLQWSSETRLDRAFNLASLLTLVKADSKGKQIRLHLTSDGRKWLSSSLEDQYLSIYRFLRSLTKRTNSSWSDEVRLSDESDSFDDFAFGDARFLGSPVSVVKVGKRKASHYWDVKQEDQQALRNAIDQALSLLAPGVFYRMDSVESYFAFEGHNPLNLGLAPDQVAVFWFNRMIPVVEEERELACRALIGALVRERLIPLGCVRVAVDDEGWICIAREPRFDAYFGRKIAGSDLAPASDVAARVVVQPDFSVIVIGLNPAPAVELMGFCERSTQGGQGAMILKITRESVIKAVSHGLKPEEITDRLLRHASHEVPANVLQEVRGWSTWVRRVTPSTLTVLRCPDSATGDRVMAALKNLGERVNETLVAIDRTKLTSVERTKLRSQGIIIEGAVGGETRKKSSKKQKRSRSDYY